MKTTDNKPDEALLDKYDRLKSYLKDMGSVAVAFSSGVDSTFLLYAASEALGGDVIAFTAASDSFPERELNETKEYCKVLGARQIVITTDELQIEGFADNPKDRCYLCKHNLFTHFKELADKENIAEIVEGSNLDDNGDYRPGLMAVAELGIKSPLREIGFTKEEIRILSKHFGLPTWDKPSFACLASRFPYGEHITIEKLRMVDKAEQTLVDMGYRQLRVRIHDGGVARIELEPSDFERFMDKENRENIYKAFKDIGFNYVALDILGYRTGSMNETLTRHED